MINITHFRPLSSAETIMTPLLSLSPLQSIKKTLPWGKITDSSDPFAKHGGYNTIVSCGIQKFSGTQFAESLSRWKEMVGRNEATKRSLMMFTWFSNEVVTRIGDETSSAWSHRDCAVWL